MNLNLKVKNKMHGSKQECGSDNKKQIKNKMNGSHQGCGSGNFLIA